MRIVVFTALPSIENTPWWRILQATPGLEAVLVYRQRPRGRAGAWKRFRANVRKHGLLWVPYRLGYAALSAARRGTREVGRVVPATPGPIPCTEIEADRLTDPGALARVAAWRPDLGLSLGAPVLKPEVFSVPARGTVNLHQGKVPDFRGAPPGFWELMGGAGEIGATAHWVDAGLDTGPVIASATAPLYGHDSLSSAQARAEELGRVVLAKALTMVAAGERGGTPQSPGGRTFRIPLLKERMALASRLAWRRARRAATARSLLKGVASVGALAILRPVRDAVRTARRGHPLRVFTFHRVTSLCRDGMTIGPAVFERQLDYIRRTHDVVPLEEALAIAASRRLLRRPAALITFDDGYLSVFETAWPLMRQRDMVGCCFVPTELIGTDARLPHDASSPVRSLMPLMAWPHLAQLVAAGWAVGAHSATHARLADVPAAALEREVDGALAALRERFRDRPVAMAYPYGGRADISVQARERVEAAGFAACFSNIFGETFSPASKYDLRRIDLGGDHGTLAWKRHVHGISFERWRWG